MAKVKMLIYSLLVTSILMLLLPPAQLLAQPELPSEGVKAEVAGEWEEAISIYEDVLGDQPERIDLWLRISDIAAHLGDSARSAEALQKAGELEPDNADIHYRISQAYSIFNRPDLALPAIERALEHDPHNLEYLKAHAEIANWAGRSDLAAESYERILELSPDDDTAALHLARSSAWSGQVDKAVSAYKEYVERHPEHEVAHIEYAKAEAWRGNYYGSLLILEDYREKFGESKDYLAEKSRALAWANRSTPALEIIGPLLDQDPNNYDVNYSHTIALRNDNRPREAKESLKILSRLRPESKETEEIRRFIMTPLRSNVSIGFDFYSDEDDLDRYHTWIAGVYMPRPETELEVGYEYHYLEAEEGSGLERFNGDEDADHQRVWVGARNRCSPEIAADGYVGVAEAEGDSKIAYGLGLEYEPEDNLFIRAERTYGFYVISPRSVDKGVREGRNNLLVVWEPDLLYTLVGEVGYDTFSDDNDRWRATFAPRRSVLRKEKINLDLGVRGTWYGFEDQNDNGYYDPDFYQSYMLTSYAYWKISDDDGVSFAGDIGAIKDDEMDDFEFGAGATVEATFGLYRGVMLKLGGGVYHNVRQDGGAFNAYSAHIILTVRF